jgi:flavin-dependent thymidylate synthase
MQVKLAGFNIDKKLIDKLGKDVSATPEVISAAYARISRSSKSVTELRNIASKDVEKARSSNWEIVFEMGHASVAEHAVFNFDLIGISRYLAEFIQRSRLASFTEKSQRYVTLDGDYVKPAEITDSKLSNEFEKLMGKSFALYSELFEQLKVQKASEQEWESKRELEGAAKEDARYVLPLCTKTQMGMTVNARSLELLLRRLASIKLQEAKELFQLLYEEVSAVAPSIFMFVKADDFTYKKLDWQEHLEAEHLRYNEITLIHNTEKPDHAILAAMLFEQQGGNFTEVLCRVIALTRTELAKLWDTFFTGLQPWHKMPRAFEMADFTLELTMSASCYAQFKRHRMCTILKAPYDTADGYVIPPAISDGRQVRQFAELMLESERLAAKVYAINPLLSPYVLTNAHRVRVLVKMNLREIYHFVRLRSDAHAQWEIQTLSNGLGYILRKKCPLAAAFLMGKSEFKL